MIANSASNEEIARREDENLAALNYVELPNTTVAMAKPIAKQTNTITGPLRRNLFIIPIAQLQAALVCILTAPTRLDTASLYTRARLLACWGILAFSFARRLPLRSCLVSFIVASNPGS